MHLLFQDKLIMPLQFLPLTSTAIASLCPKPILVMSMYTDFAIEVQISRVPLLWELLKNARAW